MQHLSVLLTPIKITIFTLQNLSHHIHTACGDSESFFRPTLNLPIFQGSAQDNGASGTVWTTISTVIVNMLREESYGVYFVSSITKQLTKLVVITFVDDTDIIHMGKDLSTSLLELSSATQQALDLWNMV